jgi:hypothetical protein
MWIKFGPLAHPVLFDVRFTSVFALTLPQFDFLGIFFRRHTLSADIRQASFWGCPMFWLLD